MEDWKKTSYRIRSPVSRACSVLIDFLVGMLGSDFQMSGLKSKTVLAILGFFLQKLQQQKFLSCAILWLIGS